MKQPPTIISIKFTISFIFIYKILHFYTFIYILLHFYRFVHISKSVKISFSLFATPKNLLSSVMSCVQNKASVIIYLYIITERNANMFEDKKMEMPCLKYLKGKTDVALDILGYVARNHHKNNLEALHLMSVLYGYSFTLNQIKTTMNNSTIYCEDILTNASISNSICRICGFSCNYTHKNISQEETLLAYYLQNRSVLDSASLLQPDKILFQSYIELPLHGTSYMTIPFFSKLYHGLFNNKKATTKELSEYIINETNCSDEVQPILQKKIENMASAKLPDNITAEEIETIIRNLSVCDDEQRNGSIDTFSKTKNDNADYNIAPDDFDMTWSADKKKKEEEKENNSSPISISNNATDPSHISLEETADENIPNENEIKETVSDKSNALYNYLSVDGYLFSDINMNNYEYIYITDMKLQLALKYELMSCTDIAIEVVSLSGTQGLLFYICGNKHYYFVSNDLLQTPVLRSFLQSIAKDKHRYVYTMFSIPLLHVLFTADIYPLENLISLYNLYNITNGKICKQPKNIIRSVTSDFSVSPNEYIPYTIQYYSNVAKKYRHRFTKEMYEEYCRLLRRNHIFAMSYKLRKKDGTNKVYLHLNSENDTYIFNYKDDISLQKSGKIVHISFKNPVNNKSRYFVAFLYVIEKLYNCKAYVSYSFRVLDCTDTSLIIFISQHSSEAFLSLLHSLLIHSGQRYISELPLVSIDVKDNF